MAQQVSQEYTKFMAFVNKNNNLWVNLIERLYDEFKYEKETTKQLLIEQFSQLGPTTCSISGRTFTINVQLGNHRTGIFKLRKSSYAAQVMVSIPREVVR